MKKTGVTTPGFFCASGSPACVDVASGIEVARRVVSRVAEVLYVQVVSAESVDGSGTFCNGSVSVAVKPVGVNFTSRIRDGLVMPTRTVTARA
jgi:hypothetical protein